MGKSTDARHTASGLPLPAFGQPSASSQATETPGSYPFTRGIYRDMYRSRLWTMRQYAGFGSAVEANARYRYLLQQGVTGLSVAFDLPTQMGRDPDHALAAGEVGRVGVSIASADDMDRLLEGIPLEQVSVSMTINATASILLAFLLVVAERRQVPWTKLQGTTQNDILKEFIARGTYIYPPAPSLGLVTDLFRFCQAEVPEWNTISISGYHIREAGSTAVDEVAFTLANGISYVSAAVAAGLSVDSFAPRLSFFFNGHSDFLEEISKFRAARRLWAKIMRERFHAQQERSWMLRFHTQTAGSTLTAQQPLNNVVRTSVEALAAVLGGTQSLHTNSYDEALGLPTEDSAKLALRTQQILAHESGVTGTADPLAGSYVIEALTDEIERRAMEQIARIDTLGGMVAAIDQGYPQAEIERAAYEQQLRVDRGEQVIVGVNRFAEAGEAEPRVLRVSPEIERDQVARLSALRSRRDGARVRATVEALSQAAKGGGALLPTIIEAARVGATLGELADALRSVFGEYHPGRV